MKNDPFAVWAPRAAQVELVLVDPADGTRRRLTMTADGRGFWSGWGPLPGPWLEPGFRRKGYGSMTERERICIKLIDRFNLMLRSVAGKPPFTHVRHLDLRGTLPHGARYKDWWADELHPSERGFKEVTRKFAMAV